MPTEILCRLCSSSSFCLFLLLVHQNDSCGRRRVSVWEFLKSAEEAFTKLFFHLSFHSLSSTSIQSTVVFTNGVCKATMHYINWVRTHVVSSNFVLTYYHSYWILIRIPGPAQIHYGIEFRIIISPLLSKFALGHKKHVGNFLRQPRAKVFCWLRTKRQFVLFCSPPRVVAVPLLKASRLIMMMAVTILLCSHSHT